MGDRLKESEYERGPDSWELRVLSWPPVLPLLAPSLRRMSPLICPKPVLQPSLHSLEQSLLPCPTLGTSCPSPFSISHPQPTQI
jgi:hypothetical protein